MTDDDPFEVVDPSGLSDADWAEINKLQRVYKEGGKRALNLRRFPCIVIAKPFGAWAIKAHGIARSRPVTKWCACHSKTASRKVLMRISSPGFGYRARTAPRFGDDRRRWRWPRMV